METKLSLLDESSVIQRPNEKLEAPGLQRTDTGLQALLPEINDAKRDQMMPKELLLGRREGKDDRKWPGGGGRGRE